MADLQQVEDDGKSVGALPENPKEPWPTIASSQVGIYSNQMT